MAKIHADMYQAACIQFAIRFDFAFVKLLFLRNLGKTKYPDTSFFRTMETNNLMNGQIARIMPIGPPNLPGDFYPRITAGTARITHSRVEWSGVEWSGVEWSGVEWSGVEWSGVEWSGVEWSGVEWSGVEWSG